MTGRKAVVGLFAGWFLLGNPSRVAYANVVCNTTITCEARLRPGSKCIDGYCTNPFQQGCLQRILGKEKFPNPRTCNSDDPTSHHHFGDDNADSFLCSQSPINYPELRISPNNWESAMFYGWILQILLSEVVNIPVTIDTGVGGGSLSFYDPKNGFSYGKKANNFDALYKANEVGDCRLVNTSNVSCAHVLPEMWQGNRVLDEEAVERDGNGMVGHVGWYMPRFAAKQDASLTHYLGLAGEENREKLATTFKRPTQWMDYCSQVSMNNCSKDDGVASRPPATEAEGKKYFVKGAYTGHFRATDQNNCTKNPTTCSGHIIDYPCTWSAYTYSQLYWNNISLESDAPGKTGSYSYSDILGIIDAANATKSPIIVVWWYPDPTMNMYEFVKLSLPEATRECLENRPEVLPNRCNAEEKALIGDQVGSCGYNTHAFEKYYAKRLREDTLATPLALRSPAYQLLRNIRISDVDISEMMLNWATRGVDKWNYDPREAVCTWVAENYHEKQNLAKFIPLGYPREIEEEAGYDGPLTTFAMTLGVFGCVLVLGTAIIIYFHRETQVVRFAQAEFLYFYCLGFFLVCLGAITTSLEPSKVSCMIRWWFDLLGFTLALVPLLLKIFAINKMLSSAQKMRRTNVSKNQIHTVMGAFLVMILLYLSLWTALAPPQPETKLVLRSDSGHIVDESLKCASSTKNGHVWKALAFTWEGIYIVLGAVMAFQSRNVTQAFNESHIVGYTAYTLFLFFVLRLMIFLIPDDAIKPSAKYGTSSILLSLDAIVATLVYFGPKLWRFYSGDDSDIQQPGKSSFQIGKTQISGLQDSGRSLNSSPSERFATPVRGSLRRNPVVKGSTNSLMTDHSAAFSSTSSLALQNETIEEGQEDQKGESTDTEDDIVPLKTRDGGNVVSSFCLVDETTTPGVDADGKVHDIDLNEGEEEIVFAKAAEEADTIVEGGAIGEASSPEQQGRSYDVEEATPSFLQDNASSPPLVEGSSLPKVHNT